MIGHLWQAVWPNMVAPSLWTLLGIGLSHLHTHRKLNAHHEALKAHVTAVAGKEDA